MLWDLLGDPEHGGVRIHAARALSAMGQEIIDAVVSVLENDSYMAFRAAPALGEMGDELAKHPAIVARLSRLLSHDNRDVLYVTAESLNYIGQYSRVHPLVNDPGILRGVVRLIFSAPDAAVRTQALRALGKLGAVVLTNPGAPGCLATLLCRPDDSAVVHVIYRRRGTRHDSEVTEMLARLKPLLNERVDDQYVLCEAVGRIGEVCSLLPSLVARIAQIASDPGSSSRIQAFAVMSLIGRNAGKRPMCISICLNSMADQDPQVRVASVQALASLVAPPDLSSTIEPVLRLIRDPEPSVSREAARVLGPFGAALESRPDLVADLMAQAGELGPAKEGVSILMSEGVRFFGEGSSWRAVNTGILATT